MEEFFMEVVVWDYNSEAEGLIAHNPQPDSLGKLPNL